MGVHLKKKPTLRSLKEKAWKLCSQLVRRTHADEGGTTQCYTCGAYLHWKLEAQAGHAIPGRKAAVLLDMEIIRPQCYSCNILKSGMHHIFSTKLIEENGLEWWLSKLEGAKRVVKLSRSDYEEAINLYKQKLAELA